MLTNFIRRSLAGLLGNKASNFQVVEQFGFEVTDDHGKLGCNSQ